MEEILRDILARLREGDLDSQGLEKILRAHNKGIAGGTRKYAKKHLMPFYLHCRENESERWASWNIDPALEQRLISLIRIKPRRTASGVATITVITKPWRCSSACLYCPNDLTMPKSYLANEPACQRAERSFFDPFLQVSARLRTLKQMGHITDKIELIVLGGTWNDYPEEYRIWFATELFRALNEASTLPAEELDKAIAERRALYEQAGISDDAAVNRHRVSAEQAAVDAGEHGYNWGWQRLYADNAAWQQVAAQQHATLDELYAQHAVNETAAHRVVGLVVETRPDTITPTSLTLLRQIGCTKIQMGVQSLDATILAANHRTITPEAIAQAFRLVRLFGFKIHAHFMANLLGATPERDILDYRRFVTGPAYQPDEVKLYPCVLIGSAPLVQAHSEGTWQPYSHEQLMDVLVADTLATPAYCRISRMIRDFSSEDIVSGNRTVNLRQSVEARLAESGQTVREIRYRELGTTNAELDHLRLDIVSYATDATEERFLQWVTPNGGIAGFLRLSLPDADYVAAHASELPIAPDEAMIREVHVYGKVAGVGKAGEAAQHQGLGKALIEEACSIAAQTGYRRINVISSVGTRAYYRARGFDRFTENGLYQQRVLAESRSETSARDEV